MLCQTSLSHFCRQVDRAIAHNLLASGYGSFSLDFQANCNRSSLVQIRNGAHCHFELSQTETIEWGRMTLAALDLNPDHLPVWKVLHRELLAIWTAGGYGSLTLRFTRESQGRIAVVEIQGGPSYRLRLPMCSDWPRHP